MPTESLQDVIDATDDLVGTFRDMDPEVSIWEYPGEPYEFPDEFTHWAEEQRAWRESAALVDQSYHMSNLLVRGEREEAIDLFAHVGVNSFEEWRTGEPPGAKQLVAVNPDGQMIGDCILFWLAPRRFLLVGEEMVPNWVSYHAAEGGFGAETEYIYHPIREGEPTYYRFELMGPDALSVADEVIDGGLDELGFFEMDTPTIDGTDAYALGHQMTGESGVEFFGSYEHHDPVREAIREAGEPHDLRQLGVKSYVTTAVELGWIPLPVPAIYEHEALQGYREWLAAESLEANYALGGSYVGEDITDYYLSPNAMGYEHIVSFDHDFIGRDALEETVDDPERTRVTFVLDDEDVVDVYASLFGDGPTNRFMDVPDIPFRASVSRYDRITKDGDVVGVSKHPAYNYNEREVAALGAIDVELAEPGTEVTFHWGDPGVEKAGIERHVEAELAAAVAPAPYIQHGRRTAQVASS